MRHLWKGGMSGQPNNPSGELGPQCGDGLRGLCQLLLALVLFSTLE